MGVSRNSFWKWGQPGKAGGTREPEEAPAGRSQGSTGNNALPGPNVVYGRQPIAVAQAQRLFMGTSLTSPMVAGRFRDQLGGNGENDPRDFGSLQVFKGLVGGPMHARLGAQAGPSSQPGFPSTNNDPTVYGLGQMDLPSLWRNPNASLQ